MKTRFFLAGLLLAGVPAFVTGCSEVVPVSGPHPALAPEQVEIFQNVPWSKYEILGTISVPVTADMKWDERGDSTAGMETFLKKAGEMGANGLLLAADQGLYDTTVGVGYKQRYYLIPLKREPRTAFARAIFVIK